MPFVKRSLTLVGGCVMAAAVTAFAAQQPAITTDGDDITIRGCVSRAGVLTSAPAPMLVWSRSDVILGDVTLSGVNTSQAVGTSGVPGHFFYWLNDDKDLSKHVGQMVEVKGDLKKFETGEVEIDRHGDVTDIEFKLGGKKEHARVPTAWLRGTGADHDQEFDVIARRVDVDDVKVLGACR